MKNEAEFKTAFKKSVKAQGGFALSLAAPMVSGIPDLYVSMPGYTPAMIEAKWLGELKNGFERLIPCTAKQWKTLKDIDKINEGTAYTIVGYRLDGAYYCNMLNSYCEYVAWHFRVKQEFAKKLVDVNTLFMLAGVPKIAR